MNETKVLSGINQLVNTDNVNPDVDLIQIEKVLNGNNYDKMHISNPEDEYRRAIEATLGISSRPTESTRPTPRREEFSLFDVPDVAPMATPDEEDAEDDEEEEEEEEEEEAKGSSADRLDSKLAMLEEIDFIRSELIETGNSVTGIEHVIQSSSYAAIESTLRLLRHKSDRIKYCTFAEEFLLMGAYAMEEAFNGERDWFGYKPDLTGWSLGMGSKFRRMRHDTSQIVSGIMHDYNISPAARILLELGPSAVLYSRQKARNKESLQDDDRLASSIKNLRDI
jgi:hypothetical protein